MGTTTAKQFLVAAGKPIIVHSFERFRTAVPDAGFILVLHSSLHADWEAIREEFLPWLNQKNFLLCEGGKERSDSVKNGLDAIQTGGWSDSVSSTPIAIHDAVRPMISPGIITDAFQLAVSTGSAVVCVPVKSSMRIKTENGSKAVDRNLYYHVQTPQVFRFNELLKWYSEKPDQEFTDDASLAEFFGCNIQMCEGSYDNLKITTPEDLAVAEILLKKEGK